MTLQNLSEKWCVNFDSNKKANAHVLLQGKYLGELLSERNGEVVKQSVKELESASVPPFKYRHLGSFAYVGDNKAVLQMPIIGELVM